MSVSVPAVRRLTAALLLAALFSLLSGCAVSGEEAQIRAGRRMMEEYLSGRGLRASVTECWAVVERPDADRLVLSDYVRGTYAADGSAGEFAVNVVTGQIYTSEQFPAFARACVTLMEERLDLEPEDCAGVCSMRLSAPTWTRGNDEQPEDRTSVLGQVLPAELDDPEGYAARAVSDGDVWIFVRLACRGQAVTADRWSLADAADWADTIVEICDFGPAGTALPAPEELDLLDTDSLAGDRIRLSHDELRLNNHRIAP